MKLVKQYILLEMSLILLLSACKNQNNFSNNNKIKESSEQTSSIRKEEPLENNEAVVWDEVTKNGVNEELLIKKIDEKTLTYIAHQVQDVCTEIIEKQKRDKEYPLKGQWYHDVMESKQYSNVISLGKEAMKPLFLIIYKSPYAGMYEWVCSKALTEISGFDFSKENNGSGWANSKEFLEMFIDRIIKQRK